MADSRIKSASEILAGFFDREVAAAAGEYQGFSMAWKTIAGPRLGEHSRPRDIRHGILLVEAEHQGWIQLLSMQQDRIVAEIRRRFPSLGIRGMAFRLGEMQEQVPAEGSRELERPEEEVPPGRMDAAERKDLTGLPEELKASFARIKNYPGSD